MNEIKFKMVLEFITIYHLIYFKSNTQAITNFSHNFNKKIVNQPHVLYPLSFWHK